MSDSYTQGQKDYNGGKQMADTNKMPPQQRDKYLTGYNDAKNKK